MKKHYIFKLFLLLILSPSVAFPQGATPANPIIDTVNYCNVTSIDVTAEPGFMYKWGTGENTQKVTHDVTANSVRTVEVSQFATNLISNSDFQGNESGYSSDYHKDQNVNPGSYHITSSLQNSPVSSDHTTGNGNFFVVNTQGSDPKILEQAGIDVTIGAEYNISFWMSTPDQNNNGTDFHIEVNGTDISGTISSPSSSSQWVFVEYSWVATSATADVSIINNTSDEGRVGFDDISMGIVTKTYYEYRVVELCLNCFDLDVEHKFFCDTTADAEFTATTSSGDCNNINWYETKGTSTVLTNGCTYVSPPLTTTTTFWLSDITSDVGCPRKKIKVSQACVEICGNGIDDNFDGNIDEGCARQCTEALPFCSSENYSFPMNVGTDAEFGPYYGCLATQPNPVWYYLKIENDGPLHVYMESPTGNDIDFACWGPFDDPVSTCDNGLTEENIVDCSYSAKAKETCKIPDAKSGEFYMLVLTNFENKAGEIVFSQSNLGDAGAGSTDCSIINPECTFLNASASVVCGTNYSGELNLEGSFAFKLAPSTGTLNIQTNTGEELSLDPPFVSPTQFTFIDITNVKDLTTLTFQFSDSVDCNYTLELPMQGTHFASAPKDLTFCGMDSLQYHIDGGGEYNWYTDATGNTSVAMSTGNNKTDKIALSAITDVTGVAPNRKFTLYADDQKEYDQSFNVRTDISNFSFPDTRQSTNMSTVLNFTVHEDVVFDAVTIQHVCWSNELLQFNIYNASTGDLAGFHSETGICSSNREAITLTGMNIPLTPGDYYMNVANSTCQIYWEDKGANYPENYSLNNKPLLSVTGPDASMSWAGSSSPAFYNFGLIAQSKSNMCNRTAVTITESCPPPECTPAQSITLNTKSGETTFCKGNSITFEPSYTLDIPKTQYYYTLIAPDGTTLYNESTVPTDIDLTSLALSGNYIFRIEDGNNTQAVCFIDDTLLITLDTVIAVDLGIDTAICDGEVLVLDAGVGDGYAWSTSAVSQTISVTESNTYSVTVSNGVCFSEDKIDVLVKPLPILQTSTDTSFCDTVVLNAGTGFDSYLWSDGKTEQTITVDTDGSYSVSVTKNACVDSVTIHTTKKSKPVLTFTGNTSVCPGDLTELTAAGADSYIWFTGETSESVTIEVSKDTVYSVVGTLDGCVDSTEATILTKPVPVVEASVDKTICFGASETISVTGTATSYEWDNSLGTGSSHTVSPDVTTVYTVTGTLDGCSQTDSVILSVNPKIIISPGNDTAICAESDILLSAAGNALSYEWDNGLGIGASHTVTPTADTRYRVTATFNGCTIVDSVYVTVKPLPVISISGTASICPGESTEITASGADSYVWDNSETSPSITVSPMVETAFVVTGTTDGCEAPANHTVSIKPLPVVNASEDVAICFNNPVTISVSGDATDWQWDNGLPTGLSHTVLPLVTTEYKVTGTLDGCSFTDSVTVLVNPEISIDPGNNTEICLGESIEVKASGNALSYEWDNGLGFGASHTVSPTTDTKYHVTASFNGCTVVDSMVIIVNDLPQITAIASSESICAGTSTTLSATGGISYVWNNGVTGNTAFEPSATATYSVTGTDNNSCSNTDEITVIVNELPTPEIVTNTNTLSVCEGDNFSVGVSTLYSGYSWSSGHITQEVPVTDIGTHFYSVTVTDENACIGVDTHTVWVKPYPELDLGADTLLCINEFWERELNIPNATFLWNNGTTQNKMIALHPGGTYWVEATVNGCTSRDDITVTYTNLPDYEIVGDTVIYEGDSAYFHVTREFASYLWNSGLKSQYMKTLPNVSAPAEIDYWVMVTDDYSCKRGDTLTLRVTEPPIINLSDLTFCSDETRTITAGEGFDTYVWSTGEISRSITVNQSGDYWVKGYKYYPALEVLDTATVTVISTPELELGEDVSICPNEAVTLKGVVADTYMWSNGSTNNSITTSSPGEYVLTVTNGSICHDSDTVVVSQLPYSTAPADQNIVYCTNSGVLLLQSEGDNIRWFDANKNEINTQEEIIEFETSEMGAAQYYITQNYNGCESDFAEINIQSVHPDASISIEGETTICAPQLKKYYTINGVTTGAEWSVSGENTLLNPTDNYNHRVLDFHAPSADTITILAKDINGCTVRDELVVYVSGDPVPDFSAEADFGKQEISFINETEQYVIPNTEHAVPNTHYWHFGRASDKMTQHDGDSILPYNYGYYNVKLKTINAYGCTDSIIKSVFMDVTSTLYIPDAFCPTHDSKMLREFRVFGSNMVDFEMTIYDAWGNTIWFTNALENGQPSEVWTAQYGEGYLPAGSYVWKIKGSFENGESFKQFGNVLLIR